MTAFMRVELECGCVTCVVKEREGYWIAPIIYNPNRLLCIIPHEEEDFISKVRNSE